MNLIAFSGFKTSGKSSAANHLVELYGAERISFAQPIREMLGVLGLTGSDLSTGKETPHPVLGGNTPRFAMQTLGTQWGREMIDQRLWLNLLAARVCAAKDAGKLVVIDDVRFANEVELIRDLGGVIIHIERPGLTGGEHASEAGIPLDRVSYTIVNNRAVENLLSLVSQLAEVYWGKPVIREVARNDWSQTNSGKQFFPLKPDADAICIQDIAHALSNLCRFGGHVKEFYSVAQHSIIVASLLPSELQLAGLLHDATEAYLVDVPRPLKIALPEYKAIEERLAKVIEAKYGVSFENPAIKQADNIALMTEARDLLGPTPAQWGVNIPPAAMTITPMSPRVARERFLHLFFDLVGQRRKEAA
jgi:hypothetical protein